jgi:hypothetical protein
MFLNQAVSVGSQPIYALPQNLTYINQIATGILISSQIHSKRKSSMLRKIFAITLLALGLSALPHTAEAGVPLPHCWPCGKK